jgi:cerevisin
VGCLHFYLLPLIHLSIHTLPAAIMRGLLGLSVLPLLAAASPVLIDTIHNDAAPILSSSNAEEIANSYMVIFKKHVTSNAAKAHHGWVQDVHLTTQNTRTELRKRGLSFDDISYEGMKHTYDIGGKFLGYSGHFDDEVVEQVRRHPDVSTSQAALISSQMQVTAQAQA